MSRVKEKLVDDLRQKAEGMLNDVLAAVEETGESGRFSLNCAISMSDVETRKIAVKIGGSVTLGQSSDTTNAVLVEDLQLELFNDPADTEESPTSEEESGEADVEEEEEKEVEEEAPAEAAS